MPEIRLLRSLQRRVAGINALAAVAAIFVAIHGAALVEDSEHQRHLDLHLQEVAHTVLGFVQNQGESSAAVSSYSPPVIFAPPPANDDLVFQVWLQNGPILLSSSDVATLTPMAPLDLRGFATGKVKGGDGRSFSMQSPDGRLLIQVAEQFEDRSADLPSLLLYYLLPMSIPLLLSMIATWSLQRREVNALDALAVRMRDRSLLDDEPIELPHSIHEMKPVIEQVNSLFLRANQAIMTEQRFIAMAAHELRTPWAGIKAQAQIAQTATEELELRQALAAMLAGINRGSHVFDQLLDMARVESLGSDLASRVHRVSLTTVYQQVLSEVQDQASFKHIELSARLDGKAIKGLDFAIYLLMRNLLSNAVRYTPNGGRIEVSARDEGAGVALCVDDSGPGIAPQDRVAAFERFNRLGQSGPDGVGLGLSIVMQVTRMHCGQIELLDSPLGGLRARVTFPHRA